MLCKWCQPSTQKANGYDFMQIDFFAAGSNIYPFWVFLQEREPIFIAVKFGGNEVRFLFSFSSAKENKAQIGLWWLVFGLTVC